MKQYLISIGMSTLMVALKEVAELPTIRPMMLKLYKTIASAYAGDPEFLKVAQDNALPKVLPLL